MSRCLAFAVFVSCLWVRGACAQSIVALEVGPSFFTSGSEYRYRGATYELESSYFNLGVLVPVNIPRLSSYVRFAVGLGDGRDVESLEDKGYVSLRNEFLVGRRIYSGESGFYVLPQVGLGLLIEEVYDEWLHGVGYNSAYVDLATTFGYSFDSFGLGVMFTFENGFWDSSRDANARLGISGVLWK